MRQLIGDTIDLLVHCGPHGENEAMTLPNVLLLPMSKVML
jgi:hypothetical protein